MKTNKFVNLTVAACVIVAMLCSCNDKAAPNELPSDVFTQAQKDTLDCARQAYAYLYPMVLMEYTKRKNTNVAAPDSMLGHAPVNQLGRMTYFPTDTFTAVVKPNVDTYYSTAFLDLGETAMVLSYPSVTERYFILPLLDAYGNVFCSLGTRTTKTNAGTYLIANTDWARANKNKPLPTGVDSLIISPTDMVWLLGRTEANNDNDQVAINYMYEYDLLPLAGYLNPPYVPALGTVDPNFDSSTPTKEQVDALSITDFFNLGAQLLVDNPSTLADKENGIVEKMAKIGIRPNKEFKLDFGLEVNMAMRALPRGMIASWNYLTTSPPPAFTINGWNQKMGDIGNFGTDYQFRAIVAYIGLGANIIEDAVYPATVYEYTDNGDTLKLDASNNYTFTMQKDERPPVDAFWSITPYNSLNFLVANDINRFALGDRSDLYFAEDSTLTFYVSNAAPTDPNQYKNWLPIPESGLFNLTMRMYMPEEAILDTLWKPPFIERGDFATK